MPAPNDNTATPNAIPSLPDDGVRSALAPDGLLTPCDSAADTCPKCGSALGRPTTSANPDPDLINGKYQVLGMIGSGGFGVVYKVKNLGLNRIEALKIVLKHRFANAEVETRFRHEVIAGARLQHAGIIGIYDTGMSDDGPFFTMEYEKGTLKDLIDLHFPKASAPKTLPTEGVPTDPYLSPSDSPESAFVAVHSVRRGEPSGPPPLAPAPPPLAPPLPPSLSPVKSEWDEVARRMALIAEAVEYMHRENVCHRDLKPSNILIGDDGHPKLTDFGLAALVAGRADDPSAGTPNYMPPEQAAEWLAQAGRYEVAPTSEEPPSRRDFYSRGDIYSLGAVFYEMLTGVPPIPSQGHPEETLKAVREGKIIPPSQVNPAVPAKLETICLECLQLDPARRYASAADVARELREAIRPRIWTLFVLRGVILLLCLALVWAFFFQPRINRHYQLQESLAVAKTNEDAARELENVWGDAATDKKRKIHMSEARKALNKVINDFGSRDPDHHLGLARLTLELGKVEGDLRNVPEALRRYRTAREQLATQTDIRPDLKWPLLAEAHHLEAILLLDAEKDLKGAKSHFDASRSLWEKLHQADPSNRDYRRHLARSHGYLGDLEAEVGRMEEAKSSYRKAKDLREALVGLPNPDPKDLYQRVRGLGNDGNYLEWEGRFDEAIEAYEYQRDQLAKCSPPIPREFQGDQPYFIVLIAELQLLTRRDAAPAKILEGLMRAKDELDVEVGLRPRFLLALGRCNHLMGRDAEAIEKLRQAIDHYLKLVHDGKAQADDYFRLSQAHAAISEVTGDPKRAEHHRVAAVIRLQEAAGRRFRNWHRVEQDPVYGKAVRERIEFAEALAKMKSRRP